ncbi:MAG TPA: ABC transporter permease [Acidimicrobiia bacterium]|jgi:spermidine/putrescine transport system permease protein
MTTEAARRPPGWARWIRAKLGRRAVPYLLLIPGGLWLLAFYVIPVAQLAGVSLQEPLQAGNPQAGYELTWRWANYSDAFSDFSGQFYRSFLYAGVATIAALLIAYPLAYAIAFRGGRYKNLLLVLVLMPFLTPFLLRTLAWKVILADSGWVVEGMQSIGLLPSNGRLLATGWAVIAGITYNFLAFMTLPLYVSLEKIDPSLIEAANDLYASPATAFRKVTLPLSMPGVVAGTLLTFIPAAGDYINAQLLGNPQQFMIGNVIDSRFLRVLDYPTAAALSFTLMLVILALIIPYVRAAGTEELVA